MIAGRRGDAVDRLPADMPRWMARTIVAIDRLSLWIGRLAAWLGKRFAGRFCGQITGPVKRRGRGAAKPFGAAAV